MVWECKLNIKPVAKSRRLEWIVTCYGMDLRSSPTMGNFFWSGTLWYGVIQKIIKIEKKKLEKWSSYRYYRRMSFFGKKWQIFILFLLFSFLPVWGEDGDAVLKSEYTPPPIPSIWSFTARDIKCSYSSSQSFFCGSRICSGSCCRNRGQPNWSSSW